MRLREYGKDVLVLEMIPVRWGLDLPPSRRPEASRIPPRYSVPFLPSLKSGR